MKVRCGLALSPVLVPSERATNARVVGYTACHEWSSSRDESQPPRDERGALGDDLLGN